MAVAEELIVAIRSDGAEQTKKDLEAVDKQFAETADQADKSSTELSGFAAKFKGAMGVAIAALSVAAIGLLAQVPVIGQAFAGVSAVIEGLLFQTDRLIRSLGGGKVSSALFDLSESIFGLEGIGSVFAGILVPLGALVGGLKLAAVAGSGTAAKLLALGAGLLSLKAILIGLIIAGVALLAAWLLDLGDTREKTAEIWDEIVGIVGGAFDTFLEYIGSKINPFVQRVKDRFAEIRDSITSWADNLANNAREWGRNLLSRFIGGIRSRISGVTSALRDVPLLGGALSLTGGGASSGGAQGLSRTTGGTNLSMDGRSLTRTTGRYESDRLTRRNI